MIAREAGALMARRFRDRTSFTVGYKGHQDYLTEVDGEVETLIVSRIATAFPGDGVIGEEGGARAGAAGAPVWVIDPIDGTANFARGVPHFCTSIACVHDGRTEIGIIYDPILDELFAARRGHGATLNGEAISVSTTDDLRRARVEIGWNPKTGADRFVELLRGVNGGGAGMVRGGSGALGVAYVAAGRHDAYLEDFINPWDVFAGL
ncbi:MAG: inositol monophosphatase, partial [Hyphomicrobiales bacterium]|nr:inositol monophosphatase [Hyphomicrobiales bacterium]